MKRLFLLGAVLAACALFGVSAYAKFAIFQVHGGGAAPSSSDALPLGVP